MAQVNELLAQGRLADAMTHLSAWYGDSRLSDTQQKEVVSLLDQLAGTVIFSRENLLEPAYEVQENDRLEEIGKRYNVPWQLLAKINGIHDAGSIQVGEKIKVVRGPFAALADLQRRELTIMVDGRYAGRFSLDVTNAEKFQGERLVVARKWSAAPESESLHNQGERWLELSDGVTLRGPRTDIDVSAGPEVTPVLRLALRDFGDLFDILSEGSQVMIRR